MMKQQQKNMSEALYLQDETMLVYLGELVCSMNMSITPLVG